METGGYIATIRFYLNMYDDTLLHFEEALGIRSSIKLWWRIIDIRCRTEEYLCMNGREDLQIKSDLELYKLKWLWEHSHR